MMTKFKFREVVGNLCDGFTQIIYRFERGEIDVDPGQLQNHQNRLLEFLKISRLETIHGPTRLMCRELNELKLFQSLFLDD